MLLALLAATASAQSIGYTEKTPLGHGFFKVKSGNAYGLIDTTDKVIVSVEYHDIRFKEGRALLIHGDNYRLYGYVDTLGHIRAFDKEYYADPTYPYFSEGYLAVRNKKNKWGYINGNETPIKQKFTEPACRFDRAYPFSEGYATIYIRRKGWQHIDKSGKERFLLVPGRPATYRTSVYKGECLIFTDEGIKQYQEAPSGEANIKIALSKTVSGINWSALDEGRLTCQGGIPSISTTCTGPKNSATAPIRSFLSHRRSPKYAYPAWWKRKKIPSLWKKRSRSKSPKPSPPPPSKAGPPSASR